MSSQDVRKPVDGTVKEEDDNEKNEQIGSSDTTAHSKLQELMAGKYFCFQFKIFIFGTISSINQMLVFKIFFQ